MINTRSTESNVVHYTALMHSLETTLGQHDAYLRKLLEVLGSCCGVVAPATRQRRMCDTIRGGPRTRTSNPIIVLLLPSSIVGMTWV